MENTKELINKSLNSLNPETRKKIFELAKDPLFTPVYDISIRNEKELAQQRLKLVSSVKAVSIRDFLTNPENIFTMHELVNISNLAHSYRW
jgi:acyl-CoA oxidase